MIIYGNKITQHSLIKILFRFVHNFSDTIIRNIMHGNYLHQSEHHRMSLT